MINQGGCRTFQMICGSPFIDLFGGYFFSRLRSSNEYHFVRAAAKNSMFSTIALIFRTISD